MSQEATPKLRVNTVHSLFFKCTAMVAVCILLVVATIEVSNFRQVSQNMADDLTDRANEVTRLLSMQLGGSVKFGNIDALDEIITSVTEAAGQDAVGALVADLQGSLMFSTARIAMDDAGIQGLIAVAKETGAAAANESGQTVVIPVRFGAENAVVGFVVSEWTDQFGRAELAHDQKMTILVGFLVMIGALLGSAYFLKNYMSRPLIEIEEAMKDVAGENYDVVVPHTGRRDEVGQMAGRLEDFRLALETAKEAAREAAFKSAAFVGSTAELMIVDESFEVIFANPACETLIDDLLSDLAAAWPEIATSSLIGANLKTMSELKEAIASIREFNRRETDGAQSVSIMLRLDMRTIQIKLNSVLDANDTFSG